MKLWKDRRDRLRAAVPLAVLDAYRRLRYGRTWYDPQGQPAQTVFREIYRRGIWGGWTGEFCSGPGSDDSVAAAYVKSIADLVSARSIQSVVDLGCGDFRVGRRLVESSGIRYHGVDVVPELIARNQAAFGSDSVSFSCGDITTAALPAADLCLIRQVLQHLSNAQISAILDSTRKYTYRAVTEHVLPRNRMTQQPNVDIHHGFETRVDVGSSVVLDEPPFNRRIDRVLCEVRLTDESVIQTVLLTEEERAPTSHPRSER